jgi:hypothetical protein
LTNEEVALFVKAVLLKFEKSIATLKQGLMEESIRGFKTKITRK